MTVKALPTLAELGRAAIEQDLAFSTLLAEMGVNAPRYRALPEAPPLCFIDMLASTLVVEFRV